MSRLSIPYLLPTVTYVMDIQFASDPGAPTWELFVDGFSNASGTGVDLSGNLYRFSITPTANATVGKSARVRIDSTAEVIDVYSYIAETANLVELGISYRHQQDFIDETNKLADVTINKAPT